MTTLRRTLLWACSLALVTGGAVTSAIPAHAATTSETVVNCRSMLNGQTFVVPLGNDLDISLTTCVGTFFLGAATDPTSGTSVDIGGARFSAPSQSPATQITGAAYPSGGALPEGTYTIYFRNTDNLRETVIYNGVFYVAVQSGDGGGSAELSAPHPHLQQFGKPYTGTCDEAASDDLNWSGVGSGGWSESWGRWEGYAGPICTRTLVYSNALAKWTVS